MEASELAEIVGLLRSAQAELSDVEVKSAVGGVPKSVRETLSALSNGSGGVIILGLDESVGFARPSRFEAVRIRNGLADACASELEPPVRADIEIVGFEGGTVVCAVVPELEPRFKPCFVKVRGEYSGSYIRTGDGDRRMTEYEIALLHSNRGQPRDDREPVLEASLDDLDQSAVAGLLRRVRRRQPAAFAGVDDETALRRLGVLVRSDDDRMVPSLAGLVALGDYPQEFFPQLNVTFVVIPGIAKDQVPPDAPRFLDNRSINGAIPGMIEETLAALARNMAVRAVVIGAGREDVYEYPIEALREAVTNALMHRDYSPYARGTQVQVEMYADRVVVRSPGGLFGAVTQDDLGEEGVSSSRNATLSTLLQDIALPGSDRVVCENRGSGIPEMIAVVRRAGLDPPEFNATITRFRLTIPKHGLLDAATRTWIDALGVPGLTSAQHLALAMMHAGRRVTNADLRRFGLDSRDATTALAELVGHGLATRLGGRRYASYVLRPGRSQPAAHDSHYRAASSTAAQRLLDHFEPGVELTATEISQRTGRGRAIISRHLNQLIAEGVIEATAPPRSKRRRYRMARRE